MLVWGLILCIAGGALFYITGAEWATIIFLIGFFMLKAASDENEKRSKIEKQIRMEEEAREKLEWEKHRKD